MQCVRGERGMTLIELLVALAVLALIVPGVLAFFAAGSRSVARAGLQTTATALVVDAMEEHRRSLLTQSLPQDDGIVSSLPTEFPRTGYSRQVTWQPQTRTVAGIQIRVWHLTVSVTYRDERQVTQHVRLETLVSPRL